MKNLVILVLSAAFVHAPVFAERKCYSLPSRSAIAVDMESVVHVDQADIFATEDSRGHSGSPFRIIGYDKDRKVMFDRVFARDNESTNELANICQQAETSTTIVLDELSIRDSFYSLSAKKLHGEFLVAVLNMSMPLNEIPNQLECTNRQEQATVSVNWPKNDDDRQLYYHRDLKTLNLLRRRGATSTGNEYLHLNSAIYQKGKNFSIRFVLSRMKGGCEPIADGRIVGDIAGDEIKNKSITYGSGEGAVVVDVVLLPVDESTEAVISESEKGPLERAGLKHRTARLNVSYGTMKIRMDMRVIVDWPE